MKVVFIASILIGLLSGCQVEFDTELARDVSMTFHVNSAGAALTNETVVIKDKDGTSLNIVRIEDATDEETGELVARYSVTGPTSESEFMMQYGSALNAQSYRSFAISGEKVVRFFGVGLIVGKTIDILRERFGDDETLGPLLKRSDVGTKLKDLATSLKDNGYAFSDISDLSSSARALFDSLKEPLEAILTANAGASADNQFTSFLAVVKAAKALNTTSTSTAPDAPTSLSATVASNSQIDLVFTDNAKDEEGFTVEYGTDGQTFSTLTTLSANVTSYSHVSLSENSTYYYRVRANGSDVNSDYSSVVSATTSMLAPASLACSATSDTVMGLTWTDQSGVETGFDLERGVTSSSFVDVATPASGSTSASDTGLTEATDYYYRLASVNGSTSSSYSGTASCSTKPSAPSGVGAAAASSSAINVSWTDNSAGESGYTVDVYNTSYTSLLFSVTASASASSKQVTGLTASTTYCFRVKADKSDALQGAITSDDSSDTACVATSGGGSE